MAARETDLYPPLFHYLTSLGYDVQAEVNHCDITARKGGDLIVIEMKQRFNLEVVVQAADRLELTDSVYIAIPRREYSGRVAKWRKRIRLLRRLGLGLLLVAESGRSPGVNIVTQPGSYQPQKRKKRKTALLEELSLRSGAYNEGGVCRRKIITAYRETAIRIAALLAEHGPQSPKGLRAMGCGPKTQSILYANHYKWFQRLERGVYGLTSLGENSLADYAEVLKNLEFGPEKI